MKTLLLLLAIQSTTLFTHYEGVRQGLLKGSLGQTKKQAASLARSAHEAKLNSVADFAQSVAVAKSLADARRSFAALSDEMIKVPGHPAVYYCPMVKKSWLQPKGKVGNPYDPAMKMCGELKAE
ncbi:MAG TPA: hypothetical protein VND45_12790 [Thermoanaerobaculia bacterium]|jgi:hypothetical protein|nr:hypothetical protein [Thermoanaerobaculia bacterium]